MGTLIVNKTALIVKAVDARLDMLLRNEQTHDVIVTPIAGGKVSGRLPWYGSLYVMTYSVALPEAEQRRAAIQADEFGGFNVYLGDYDSIVFPGPIHGHVGLSDFADPTDAAEVILNYLNTGDTETPYKRKDSSV